MDQSLSVLSHLITRSPEMRVHSKYAEGDFLEGG